MVLSLVRNNAEGNVGELLKDWRRVNVSLTRARTKLLIIGSRKTLQADKLLNDFITLVDGKGWRFDLPQEALEMHVFDGGATQVSGRAEEMAGPGVGVDAAEGMKPPSMMAQGKENEGVKGKKVPMKTGKVDIRALVGKRPVLRDIVNDAA